MSKTGSNETTRSLTGPGIALAALTILSWPSTGAAIACQPKGQQDKSLVVTENLKRLAKEINGNVFEVGKRDSTSKYEIYKYEAFGSDGCSIRWRETHEIYDAGRRIMLEVQDVMVPLPRINPDSVVTDKSNSGHLVSFATQKLEPGITAHVHSVYGDGSENESTAIQTGYGFYFPDRLVAQSVAKALISAIRSCSKAKSI